MTDHQHPQYGVPGAWGRLVIHANAGAAFAITSPKVYINGSPAAVRNGTTVYTVPAGWNAVAAKSRGLYFIPLSAHVAVYVPPNGAVEVFYATPVHWAGSPRLGAVPQKRSGKLMLAAVVAVLVLFAISLPLMLLIAGY